MWYPYQPTVVHGDNVRGDKFGGDKVAGDKYVGWGDRPEPGRWHRGGGVVLLLTANPQGTTRLRTDDEQRAIDDGITFAQARNRLRVERVDAVRLDDLQGALQRYRPVVAHFCGHGTATGGLLVADEFGLAQPVPRRALGELFGLLRDSLRCVVLNACFSYAQALVVAEHVPCVIGMRGVLPEETALRFVGGLYEALAYGRSVGSAFHLGCNRLRLHGHADADLPVLLAAPGVADRTVVTE